MEKLLLRIARQINAFDEASLMALWDKYAEQVSRFEPTRRWEEAAILFGVIQAMRMKNQLFNYSWAQTSKPPEDSPDHPGLPSLQQSRDELGGGDCAEAKTSKPNKRGKLIKLPKKER